jgi:hypothetical protein
VKCKKIGKFARKKKRKINILTHNDKFNHSIMNFTWLLPCRNTTLEKNTTKNHSAFNQEKIYFQIFMNEMEESLTLSRDIKRACELLEKLQKSKYCGEVSNE